MKGNFWRKIFHKVYDTKDHRYNGWMAKTDARTTRSKLKRFLDKVFQTEEQL